MKNILQIIIILSVMTLLIQCTNEEESMVKPDKGKTGTLVGVVPAQRIDLRQTLDVTGSVEPQNIANVISTSEGRITRLNVLEGDTVQAEQTLAMISPVLREDIITAARQQVVKISNELKSNPLDPQLKINQKQAEADLQFAQDQYQEVAIVSPVGGLISNRYIDIGDMVQAKSRLFEVQSAGQFKINLSVSERDLSRLKNGQQAVLQLDACPDHIFNGTIMRIYPNIDTKTRYGIVELKLNNPCPNVKSGMFVRAEFTVKIYKSVLAIPILAIIERPGKKTVFIEDENDTAIERVVETGYADDTMVEIISGLTDGQHVIVEGQNALKTGSAIKVKQPQKEKVAL